METARKLDVSHLPSSAFDERSPLWWGNLLLILVETTTVVLLVAGYFYCRLNFVTWPPPKVDVIPPLHHPVPDLGPGTANAILLVLSCVAVYLTDQAARKQKDGPVRLGLTVLFVIGLASLVLRAYEFPATHFWWNDNAYASIVWTLLGLHLTYILAGVLEFFIMGLWVFKHHLDKKHALDVTLAGGYWYWVAGIWVLCYAVIYWAPRVL